MRVDTFAYIYGVQLFVCGLLIHTCLYLGTLMQSFGTAREPLRAKLRPSAMSPQMSAQMNVQMTTQMTTQMNAQVGPSEFGGIQQQIWAEVSEMEVSNRYSQPCCNHIVLRAVWSKE